MRTKGDKHRERNIGIFKEKKERETAVRHDATITFLFGLCVFVVPTVVSVTNPSIVGPVLGSILLFMFWIGAIIMLVSGIKYIDAENIARISA